MILHTISELYQHHTTDKQRVIKSSIRYELQNNFYIVEPSVKFILELYDLLYWSPSYFKSKLVDGRIEHKGEYFQVIYKDCSPASLKYSTQLKLSFRAPKKELQLESYVLVKRNTNPLPSSIKETEEVIK